jgi:hypothetical protein
MLGLAALVSLSGCGTFTNVPAQVKVAKVDGATLTYEKPDATDGWRTVKIDPAILTLQGEPGSIGVTFEQMKVDYFQINNTRVPAAKIPVMDLRVSVRVESSHYPNNPAAAPLNQADVGKTVYAAKTDVELPIVTRHVSAYGGELDTNAGAIWAQVELIGNDDAGFPAKLVAYVPITFIGPPNGAK